MPKINAYGMVALAALAILLICGLVSGLDLHNEEKLVAFAEGKDDILGLASGQEMVLAWEGDNFQKSSQSFLNANGANMVSLDKSGSLAVLYSDGTTKTYGNQITQSLKLSDSSDVQMLNSYVLNNGQSVSGIKMSFTNPKTGESFDMAEVDPNDPTKVIEKFISAMDLGMSYERIQGLQYNIGIVGSEKTTKDGMEFEYSLGKNTEISV